jgi:hypothetical protein
MPTDGDTVITCCVLLAVKLYHTSSSALPTHPAKLEVAPTVVPDVKVQAELTVRGVAVAQLLL